LAGNCLAEHAFFEVEPRLVSGGNAEDKSYGCGEGKNEIAAHSFYSFSIIQMVKVQIKARRHVSYWNCEL
jgi:hypothetical protein